MKALKIKDYVFLAIVTALYMVIYTLFVMLTAPLGPIGHSLSPGLFALAGGTIIYFVHQKLGKMWEFSIMTLILMGFFTLMGGGYLPWLITSMLGAVLADLLASANPSANPFRLAIGYGLMQVGMVFGSIVPVWFFVDRFREDWIQRGQTPEAMDATIASVQGILGVWISLASFALAFAGVYIGYFILKKHFANQKNGEK